jgi:hypothetical protein
VGHANLTAAQPMPISSDEPRGRMYPKRLRASGQPGAFPFRTEDHMRKLAKVAPPALSDWGRRFEPQIPVQNGAPLRTLKDAAQYVLALPAVEQQVASWQVATEVLKMVAETGAPTMMARIAVMKALHHRAPEAAQMPRRKRVKSYTIAQ